MHWLVTVGTIPVRVAPFRDNATLTPELFCISRYLRAVFDANRVTLVAFATDGHNCVGVLTLGVTIPIGGPDTMSI